MNNVNRLFTEISGLPMNERVELLRKLNSSIAQINTRSLEIGQNVYFVSRTGARIDGVVTKINRKSVKVAAKKDRYGVDAGRNVMWTVSPSLIQVAQ